MKIYKVQEWIIFLKRCLKNLFKTFQPVWILLTYIIYVQRGANIYRRIKELYGNNVVLLFSPQAGTGDAYLTGLALSAYLEKNQLQNWVLLYPSGSGLQVLNLFGITKIIALSVKERICFQRFFLFMGNTIPDINVMHYHIPTHSSFIPAIEGRRNLNFHKMFFEIGLGLNNFRAKMPAFSNNQAYILNLFDLNNLQKGNTVVLAPYTNTVPTMSLHKWEVLAQKLLSAGYSVCTNTDKKKCQPIPGTVPLQIPIEFAVPILNVAGFFIGARSGFCEVIESSTCKKIILYPHAYSYGAGTATDFFGFKKSLFFKGFEEYEFF